MGEGLIVRRGGGGSNEGSCCWTRNIYEPSIVYTNPSCNLKASTGAKKLVLTNCTFDCTRITENYIDFFNGFKTNLYSDKYYFDKFNSKLAWYFANGTMMYVTGIEVVSETACNLLFADTISSSASMGTVAYKYSGSKSVPEKKTVIKYVVDDDSSAYPNGAVHTDGYYYKLLGQVSSTNVMSLSDTALATVQADYRDQIVSEVSQS